MKKDLYTNHESWQDFKTCQIVEQKKIKIKYTVKYTPETHVLYSGCKLEYTIPLQASLIDRDVFLGR